LTIRKILNYLDVIALIKIEKLMLENDLNLIYNLTYKRVIFQIELLVIF